MKTPGKKAANWIENFCVVPAGFDKGQHVVLTVEQKEILRRLFDTDESPGEIAAPLSSYLALLALAGPRALAERLSGIELNADVFTTWAAIGPASQIRAAHRWRGYRLPGIANTLPARRGLASSPLGE